MLKVKEINLEENYPTVQDAMEMLKWFVKQCKSSKTKCIVVIHGYGSSGKGGVIRKQARQWLNAQVNKGMLKGIVYGEDFNVFNSLALELKAQHPELESLMRITNHGVTVVSM